MANSALSKAKDAKQDEFYTRLEDVEQELAHYREHFEGKVIYLNCDDPEFSAFWQYFSYNFDFFGLKKLMATHYASDGGSSYMLMLEEQYDTNDPNIVRKPLKGDGDFRSDECIELLKEADIVATNPPFSLFREYMAQLMEYDKKFVIIGNQNAFTYKEIFPLIQERRVWSGYKSGGMAFRIPDHYPDKSSTYIGEDGYKYQKLGNICWFTNLEIGKRHEEMVLTRFYEGNEETYPTYDNYDAIEVSKVKEIPMDYGGVMGVPITFINNFNPEQFEILGMTDRQNTSGLRIKKYTSEDTPRYNDLNARSVIKLDDGTYKVVYARILIRNKKPVTKRDMLGF